jgi:hypothetical protein
MCSRTSRTEGQYRPRRPAGDARHDPGAEGLRAAGLSRHARGRQHADPGALVRAGVRDMIRVSDARMSGTAFGTVILHVAPEAQAGGPLALVRPATAFACRRRRGNWTCWSDEAELAARRAAWQPDPPRMCAATHKLYVDHVLQADRGADLDFLVGKDTRPRNAGEPLMTDATYPRPRTDLRSSSPAAARASAPA